MRLITILGMLLIVACNNHQNPTSIQTNDTTINIDSNTSIDTSLIIQDDSEVFPTSIDTVVLGNIDQNASKDTAFIQAFNSRNQTVSITFSSGLPTLLHGNGFGGYLIQLDDFNKDGILEILYYPDWFQSNWAGYFIYTLKNNQWQLMAEGTCTRDAVNGNGYPTMFLKSRVKKINANTLQLIDHEMGEDGNIIEVSKEVKF